MNAMYHNTNQTARQNLYHIGLDFGGSKIAGAAVSFKPKLNVGKIYQEKTPKTRQKIVGAIIDIIKRIKQDYSGKKISAIGIGAAGLIDASLKRVVFSTNISDFRGNVPLGKILEKKFKIPVILENDTNCFALAEACFGAGKKRDYVLGVTIGTGVGGGIIIDTPPHQNFWCGGKEIFHGGHNVAGEIGHIIVGTGKGRCSCGSYGCLEQYVNKRAITKSYFETTGKHKTPREIEFESYLKKKNNPALKIIKEAGEKLGIGLASIANILDPDIIVLGGGIAKIKTLYSPARLEFEKRVLPPLKKIPIVYSRLGGTKAGIIGAAIIAGRSGKGLTL